MRKAREAAQALARVTRKMQQTLRLEDRYNSVENQHRFFNLPALVATPEGVIRSEECQTTRYGTFNLEE